MEQEIIGILGGTFNPIHNGHIEIAKLAHEQFHIPIIYIMPSGDPSSYKETDFLISAQERCNMVQKAIQPYPYMKLSTLEVERKGKTYTADTLKQLYTPNKKIYFIIGADSLLYLEKWKNPEYICTHCILLVANRDNEPKEHLLQQKRFLEDSYNAKIEFINVPMLPYSSTSIREAVRSGMSIGHMVDFAVNEYILEHRLYQ